MDDDYYVPKYRYIFAFGKDISKMKSKSYMDETKTRSFYGEERYIETILNIEVSDGKESQESIS
jgi:hypothetical protein